MKYLCRRPPCIHKLSNGECKFKGYKPGDEIWCEEFSTGYEPKLGEWLWLRFHGSPWMFCKFREKGEDGYYYADLQDGGYCRGDEVIPFEGNLPPGLEETEESKK